MLGTLSGAVWEALAVLVVIALLWLRAAAAWLGLVLAFPLYRLGTTLLGGDVFRDYWAEPTEWMRVVRELRSAMREPL